MSHSYKSTFVFSLVITLLTLASASLAVAETLSGNHSPTPVELGCSATPEGPIPTNEWINVYCAHPSLNDVPLQPGDVVKAYDPDGILCGMDVVRADGSFGFMPIYRDDAWSPTIDEGAHPGDTISFKVNDVEVLTDPVITWIANGSSFALCDFFNCRIIHLNEGWNLISWNLEYSAPIGDFLARFDDDNCVDVIMSFENEGQTYDPLFPQYSTLDNVDYYHGYWIRLDCEQDIEICGRPIERNEYIPIEAGWNLVSYWPEAPLAVPDAISSILGCTDAVMGFDAGALIWLPGKEPFNTLTNMEELLGYWIKTSCAGPLTYPGWTGGVPLLAGCTAGNPDSPAGGVSPSRFWMSLYGSNVTIDGKLLDNNSIISAYGPSGAICGAGSYRNGKLRFTPVYGKDEFDPETETYPAIGDLISVNVNGAKVYPEVAWTGGGTALCLSELKTSPSATSGSLPMRYDLGQNYPNPVNPSTVIPFSTREAGHARLSVYNLLGQEIRTLVDEQIEAGDHQAAWDGTDGAGATVATGIYFYRLEAGSFVDTKKMVLLK